MILVLKGDYIMNLISQVLEKSVSMMESFQSVEEVNKPNQTKPNQIKPNQTEPHQTKKQIKPNQNQNRTKPIRTTPTQN